jgi:hypothetical protein
MKVVRIPDGANSAAVRVDHEGRIAVLRMARLSVSIFDANGNLTVQTPLRHGIANIAFFRGRLVGLDTANAVIRNEPEESQFAALGSPLSWASFLVNVLDRKIAVIDQAEPTIRVVESGVVTGPLPLAAPEIVSSKGLQLPEDTIKILVGSAAADYDGNIWCLVHPYSPSKGANVLAFDTKGRLRTRLLCKLPAAGVPPEAGRGVMAAHRLGIAGRTLIIMSMKDYQCAYYDLSKVTGVP